MARDKSIHRCVCTLRRDVHTEAFLARWGGGGSIKLQLQSSQKKAVYVILLLAISFMCHIVIKIIKHSKRKRLQKNTLYVCIV